MLFYSCVIILLPLAFGVWLPNVMFGHKTVVARQPLARGGSVEVVQYWVRGAHAYKTDLVYRSPTGYTKTNQLTDTDHHKLWRVHLELDGDTVVVRYRSHYGSQTTIARPLW
jgi:hypothetical protein